jgi:hypothetical protein
MLAQKLKVLPYVLMNALSQLLSQDRLEIRELRGLDALQALEPDEELLAIPGADPGNGIEG